MFLINIIFYIVVMIGGFILGKLWYVFKKLEEVYYFLFIKGLVKLCEMVCGLFLC